jgi:tetratricopeptide (TPR) repeat protein
MPDLIDAGARDTPRGVAAGGGPAVARPPNPYILTPLTEGFGFYGREAVLQFVRNTLTSPFQNVVVVFGQRRIGKTSILYQLMRSERTPPGFRPVYFDLQGRAEHGMDQVLYGLAREIARSLRIPVPPRSAFAEESFFQYGFLPEVYRALGDDRLLVLVDEFDVLGGEEVTPDAAYHVLFGYLQDLLIDEQRNLAFVFVVGRRLDELPSRIKATFKSAQCKRISLLGRSSAESLITEPAAGVIAFSDAAVNRLLDLTSGHPYFLQLFCYEIYERLTRAGRRRVEGTDISDDLVSTAMELGMGGLAWFWDEFPPAERFILSTIAHLTQGTEAATLRQIGQALHDHGVRLQGMELSTAPMLLEEWEIIESAGRDAYRFRVEFLRRWILSKHSLDEAKRELEQVSARAVVLYENGRRLHVGGDLAGAITEYRRALAANPNHARAQLGMAQALYESGQLEVATDTFEKAFRLDPASAYDGLLAAHRDLGTALENEGQLQQARLHYQRVLDINPADQTARIWMRDSWRSTAGEHLAGGRWDKATEAYRAALQFVPDDEVLQQALAALEERHLEVEVRQRRRRQLERAALEARLKEEQTRRQALEATVRRALNSLLAAGAAVLLVGAMAISVSARVLTGGVWPIVVGVGIVILYVTHHWITRHLPREAAGPDSQSHVVATEIPPHDRPGSLDAREPVLTALAGEPEGVRQP